MKIAIIGGGSSAWMPQLLPDFVQNDFFTGASICLMDINAVALERVLAYSEMLLENPPGSFIVFSTTTELDQALEGADFVIVAISQGNLEGEIHDHVIARKYGYYNIKGSEVGIAGASRTLRHTRELVRIANRMKALCPKATLLNVTNPLTALTRAVEKYANVHSVGFCHGVRNHLEVLFPLFGADGWEGVDFLVGGVDHCSWQLDIRLNGRDALQILREGGWIERAKLGDTIAAYDDPFAGRENQRLRMILWDTIGYLPAISDEHCAEFFGQFMGSEALRKYYNITYDRIEERTTAVERSKLHLLDILKGRAELPAGRSNECIDRFIQAICGGGAWTDVLNYRNIGQISNLPYDSVVESKCLVDATGVHPVMVGKLPPILESIVRPVIIREELYMDAAMEEDIGKLKAGLSTDPLVNDFQKIDALCDELMKYNLSF